MNRYLRAMRMLQISFLASSGLLAGTLFSETGGSFSGIAGNPAANPCAATVTHTDGSPASIVNCVAFSSVNPANSLAQSWTFSGYAEASYRVLKASSSSAIVNANMTAGSATTSGYARVTDQLTGALAATDTVAFVFDLDGAASQNGFNFSRLALSFGFNYGGSSPVSAWQFIATTDTHGQVRTPAYPVAYFQAYPYFISMAAMNPITNRTGSAVTASATVDFAHTLSIAGVEVRDAAGVIRTGVLVGSEGIGPLAALNTPEPSSLAMAGGALALLGYCRRRR